jgi:hypothetical protein
MVRIHPDPPGFGKAGHGAVAQLGEHLLCKQGVVGSIPISSTTSDIRDQRSGGSSRTHGLGSSYRLHDEQRSALCFGDGVQS